MQYATDVRDAQNDAFETAVGASPILRAYNGTMPATTATALSSNTLIAQGTLPADWMTNSSGGVKTKLGTWTLTGQSGAGTGTLATFFRLFASDGTTCKAQGTFGAAIAFNTSAATAINSNVLTFAATTGVAIGQTVTGAGVQPGTTVLALTGTTVTMSQPTLAGVASGAAITFGAELVADNANIANGQTVTVSAFSITRGNA
jgi:hypothetical protein